MTLPLLAFNTRDVSTLEDEVSDGDEEVKRLWDLINTLVPKATSLSTNSNKIVKRISVKLCWKHPIFCAEVLPQLFLTASTGGIASFALIVRLAAKYPEATRDLMTILKREVEKV